VNPCCAAAHRGFGARDSAAEPSPAAQAARETYCPALARVLGRVTETVSRRYAIARACEIVSVCPEAAAQLFGPALFPSRSAVMAAWEGRTAHSAATLMAAGAEADAAGRRGAARARPTLAELDVSRLGYDYEAAAAAAEQEAAVESDDDDAGAGDSAATAVAEEALQGVIRALPRAAGEAGDAFAAVRAASLASRVCAGAAAAASLGASLSGARRRLPRPLARAVGGVCRFAAAVLGDRSALSAPRGSAAYAIVDAALSAVATLARAPALRPLLHRRGVVALLVPLLSSAESERAYGAALAVWSLSLDASCRSDLDSADAVHGLCALVSPHARKPKVVRVALAALASVARDPEAARDAVPLMAETHLGSSLGLVLSRSDDEDVVSDAESLQEALAANHRVLSSLERYDRELSTGRLSRSPVHTPVFWRENFAEFEAGGCRRLRRLRGLLRAAAEAAAPGAGAGAAGAAEEEGKATEGAGAAAAGAGGGGKPKQGGGDDDEAPPPPSHLTTAVACSDVGEFAAAHPNGRL